MSYDWPEISNTQNTLTVSINIVHFEEPLSQVGVIYFLSMKHLASKKKRKGFKIFGCSA